VAIASVSDASESSANDYDAEAARFRQLEHFRARRRSRRQQRFILSITVVAVSAGLVVFGVTTMRPSSTGSLRDASPHPALQLAPSVITPVVAPLPPAVSTPTTIPEPAAAPTTAPKPATTAAPATAPRPAAAPARLRQTTPAPAPTPHLQADAPAPASASRPVTEATDPPRAEPREVESGDGTAVIDWLLKASRR
jgi:hypothetical protein